MKRNKFSLSHTRNFTCDMGQLVPIGLTEVLPGDSFNHSTGMLLRCSPLMAPVMHPVDVRIHHWFCPTRLVFDGFEDFITGGPDGADDTVPPTITFAGGVSVGSLGDYLGLPTGVNDLEVSALPFRMYNLIWNENYRDQDLVTPAAISDAPGPDTATATTLKRIAWEKDYFTSARPWEQKGPTVTVPLGDEAIVRGIGIQTTDNTDNGALNLKETGGTQRVFPATRAFNTAGSLRAELKDHSGTWYPNIRADLQNASAITVTRLRQALAIQRFQEWAGRFGSRYGEYLRKFGIRSSDARLQRPEYLGGGRQTIQFSEVLQTAEGEAPVGEMRGHGIAAVRSNRYVRWFEEHGFVMTLLSVRPKTMYIDGLPRHWSRKTKEDYWQKEYEHIGQQEVLNKEVYALHGTPNGVFGFQDRYDEYRRAENWISGEFRSLLTEWHFARKFGSAPALNADFVTCVPPETPFAAQDNHVLWCMARHSLRARRLVAARGSSFTF